MARGLSFEGPGANADFSEPVRAVHHDLAAAPSALSRPGATTLICPPDAGERPARALLGQPEGECGMMREGAGAVR